jgi:hypothetical protein
MHEPVEDAIRQRGIANLSCQRATGGGEDGGGVAGGRIPSSPWPPRECRIGAQLCEKRSAPATVPKKRLAGSRASEVHALLTFRRLVDRPQFRLDLPDLRHVHVHELDVFRGYTCLDCIALPAFWPGGFRDSPLWQHGQIDRHRGQGVVPDRQIVRANDPGRFWRGLESMNLTFQGVVPALELAIEGGV